MEKLKLIEEIENLPEFEMKEIAVKDDGQYHDNEYFMAIVEKGKPNIIYSVVSKRYKLVQFKDVFIPAIEKIERIKFGYVYYFGGKAIVEVYPEGEEFVIDNKWRVGISLKNSVDKSMAIKIGFSIISTSGEIPAIPLTKEGIGLKKLHVGKVKVIEDYLKVLEEVKMVWKVIVTKFQEEKLEKDMLEGFAKSTGIGERIKKKIEKLYVSEAPTLWEVFKLAIKEIANRNFKSELHRKKKLEKIANSIIRYALAIVI